MVKPMPVVVVELLRRLAEERPDASTLADLLPQARRWSAQLTPDDDHAALKATTARFLSAGSAAVVLGIDRLYAALLTNDFAIIPDRNSTTPSPGARACLGSRQPGCSVTWAGGRRSPVLGSPIVHTSSAAAKMITDWLMWMAEEVKHKPRVGTAALLSL